MERKNCYALCAGAGLTVVIINLALLPLYLSLARKEEKPTCYEYSLGQKFGRYGDLNLCNDTLNSCVVNADTNGSNVVLNCSVTTFTGLQFIKDIGVTWDEFAALSVGVRAFFTYGRCMNDSIVAHLHSHTCTLPFNSQGACLPYNIDDCPTKSMIDASTLKNLSSIPRFRLPNMILVYEKSDGMDEASGHVAINNGNITMCPSKCILCDSDLSGSITLLLGSSAQELC